MYVCMCIDIWFPSNGFMATEIYFIQINTFLSAARILRVMQIKAFPIHLFSTVASECAISLHRSVHSYGNTLTMFHKCNDNAPKIKNITKCTHTRQLLCTKAKMIISTLATIMCEYIIFITSYPNHKHIRVH